MQIACPPLPAWCCIIVMAGFGCGASNGDTSDRPAPECTYDGHDYSPTGWGLSEPAGIVRTDLVDIDYTGGSARVGMSHERDVDEAEDGCVKNIQIEIENSAGGCDLHLVYDPELRVTRLDIDNDCPGWDGAQEGEYENTNGDGPAPEGIPRVTGNVSQACLDVSLQLTGSVTVSKGGQAITLDLSNVSITGAASSGGDREFSGPECPFE
jgi:hypothetical protein